MKGAQFPSQIGEPRFHRLHSMAKKRKKSIRKKIVPFLEPCESSCLKPWCRSGNGLCSQDHLEVSFEYLPQGPFPTSLSSTVKHTLLLTSLFPTFVSSLAFLVLLVGVSLHSRRTVVSTICLKMPQLRFPRQHSWIWKVNVRDMFQNLGAGWWQGWELAKGEHCQMKNEAEEVQGAVQVNCLSETPQQQYNTTAQCPNLQHLQFPWYKYSSCSTWPISRYQWFSASPQNSWLLAIGPLQLTGATTTGSVPKLMDLALLKALHQEFCNEKDARSKMNETPNNEIQSHSSMPWERENHAPSWGWWEKSVKHRN